MSFTQQKHRNHLVWFPLTSSIQEQQTVSRFGDNETYLQQKETPSTLITRLSPRVLHYSRAEPTFRFIITKDASWRDSKHGLQPSRTSPQRKCLKSRSEFVLLWSRDALRDMFSHRNLTQYQWYYLPRNKTPHNTFLNMPWPCCDPSSRRSEIQTPGTLSLSRWQVILVLLLLLLGHCGPNALLFGVLTTDKEPRRRKDDQTGDAKADELPVALVVEGCVLGKVDVGANDTADLNDDVVCETRMISTTGFHMAGGHSQVVICTERRLTEKAFSEMSEVRIGCQYGSTQAHQISSCQTLPTMAWTYIPQPTSPT